MDAEKSRVLIKYVSLKRTTPSEIKNDIDSTLADSSSSLTTIYKWIAEFRRGIASTKGATRSGRLKMATSEEMVRKVEQIVLADRRMKVRERAEALHILNDRGHLMLHESLGMKKLSGRWVPRSLTSEQKEERVPTSKECLELIKRDPNFYRSFIAMDETWLHYYTPETK